MSTICDIYAYRLLLLHVFKSHVVVVLFKVVKLSVFIAIDSQSDR